MPPVKFLYTANNCVNTILNFGIVIISVLLALYSSVDLAIGENMFVRLQIHSKSSFVNFDGS